MVKLVYLTTLIFWRSNTPVTSDWPPFFTLFVVFANRRNAWSTRLFCAYYGEKRWYCGVFQVRHVPSASEKRPSGSKASFRLKIPRWRHCTGSSPVTGTKLKKSEPNLPSGRRVRISSFLLLWLLPQRSSCSQRIKTERSEEKEEVWWFILSNNLTGIVCCNQHRHH